MRTRPRRRRVPSQRSRRTSLTDVLPGAGKRPRRLAYEPRPDDTTTAADGQGPVAARTAPCDLGARASPIRAVPRRNAGRRAGVRTSPVMVPSITACATVVRLVLVRRAWARIRVKASATLRPERAARTPLACSTRILLWRAVWSCSDKMVCSCRLRWCSTPMVATSAIACPTATSSSLRRAAVMVNRFNAPMMLPRSFSGRAWVASKPAARAAGVNVGQRVRASDSSTLVIARPVR